MSYSDGRSRFNNKERGVDELKCKKKGEPIEKAEVKMRVGKLKNVKAADKDEIIG